MIEHELSLDELLLSGRSDELFHHAEGCGSCSATLLLAGSYPVGCCQPQEGYQVLLHLDELSDPEADAAATLVEHVSSCSACQEEVEQARLAINELNVSSHELFDFDDPELGLALRCGHCEETLARADSACCAGCHAPHHPQCFGQHQQCARPACGARASLRRLSANDASHRRALTRRWVLGWLLLLLTTAALSQLSNNSSRDRAQANSPQAPSDKRWASSKRFAANQPVRDELRAA